MVVSLVRPKVFTLTLVGKLTLLLFAFQSEQKIREIESLEAKLISTEREATQTIQIMREKFEREHEDYRKKHKSKDIRSVLIIRYFFNMGTKANMYGATPG